ncbi:MAG: alanine--glyoxylate aminotransferase family protein [Planctomycetes bacterium]|nr:alanine--glyoxylate aminotransferase family protein [Planctomycetota bacterium]
MTIKYFYPGPVFVKDSISLAQTKPMISHRSEEFRQLYISVNGKLKKLLRVKNGRIFLLTSSSTGAMEVIARNLIKRNCITVSNGAFGDRIHEVFTANGKRSVLLTNGWGKNVDFEQIRNQLEQKSADCISLVHNETSVGFTNKDELFREISKQFSNITLCVDTVSSFGVYPLFPEQLGIDFLFAGTQKGLAIPPGLTIMYVSKRAIEKAKSIRNRGFYFDLLRFAQFDESFETPQTPALALIYALDAQLDRILDEGIQNRFRRHKELAEITKKWAEKNGFRIFVNSGSESCTVTCIENLRNIKVSELLKKVKRIGYTFSNGFGILKEKTFRIGHMGEITKNDLKDFFTVMDKYI